MKHPHELLSVSIAPITNLRGSNDDPVPFANVLNLDRLIPQRSFNHFAVD